MRIAKTQMLCDSVSAHFDCGSIAGRDPAPCLIDHRFGMRRPQRFFDSIFSDGFRKICAKSLDLAR